MQIFENGNWCEIDETMFDLTKYNPGNGWQEWLKENKILKNAIIKNGDTFTWQYEIYHCDKRNLIFVSVQFSDALFLEFITKDLISLLDFKNKYDNIFDNQQEDFIKCFQGNFLKKSLINEIWVEQCNHDTNMYNVICSTDKQECVFINKIHCTYRGEYFRREFKIDYWL